jgi:hypothetical protein
VLTGVTLAEPDSARAAALMLGAIVTEVALVLAQVSVTDCPAAIWLVAAVMLAVGAGVGSV